MWLIIWCSLSIHQVICFNRKGGCKKNCSNCTLECRFNLGDHVLFLTAIFYYIYSDELNINRCVSALSVVLKFGNFSFIQYMLQFIYLN